jgi:hypothetical protein
MKENLFQNIDSPPPQKPSPVRQKPQKKIIILIGLSALIIILLLASFFVSLSTKKTTTVKNKVEQPSPMPTRTDVNQPNQISTLYQADFDNITSSLNYSTELLPPQIDLSIGN